MEALGKVILYVPEEVNTKIKETIAKVKDTNNYDTNAKALSKCTKSDLQVTLAFLLWKEEGDSEIEELITLFLDSAEIGQFNAISMQPLQLQKNRPKQTWRCNNNQLPDVWDWIRSGLLQKRDKLLFGLLCALPVTRN